MNADKRFYIGLDLGQRRDHSAIAVVERLELYRGYQTPVFQSLLVRHLERVALGTPYPIVVTRVREVVRQAQAADGADGRAHLQRALAIAEALQASGRLAPVDAPMIPALREMLANAG